MTIQESSRQPKIKITAVKSGEAEAILLANMGIISQNLQYAYSKVEQMIAASSKVFTVDEGELKLNIVQIGGLAGCQVKVRLCNL